MAGHEPVFRRAEVACRVSVVGTNRGFDAVFSRMEGDFDFGDTSRYIESAETAAVQRYLDLRRIGIDTHTLRRNACRRFHTRVEPTVTAADMDDRVGTQHRLVVEIGVFRCAVERAEPFAVDVGHGIAARFGIEVVEIPRRGAADERTREHLRQVVLVVEHGVIDREVEALGLSRTDADVAVGSVFGDEERFVGVSGVHPVELFFEVGETAAVPSLIEIDADDIGNLQQTGFVVEGQIAVAGQHRRPRRVEPASRGIATLRDVAHPAQVIGFVAFIGEDGRTQHHFVHVGPNADRGRIVVLEHHFGHHPFAAVGECVAARHGIDDRNFY